MTKLVGILNLTPDSFSDGGSFVDPEVAISYARHMVESGASLIDVGAESTRPGAQPVSEEEEWARLEPVLPRLLEEFPGIISLDTYKPAIVRRAYLRGAVIINDVTALADPDMVDAAADLGAKVIVSHIAGPDIQTAHQQKPTTTVEQVLADLRAKEAHLVSAGINSDNIIFDPGIGFGKSQELNIRLLGFASDMPDRPVMIGYSRKRFLGDGRYDAAVNVAAGKIAAQTGAEYLRVHDVEAHTPLINQPLD